MVDGFQLRAERHPKPLLVLVGVLFGSWTIWATVVMPQLPPASGAAYHVRAIGVRLLLWVVPSLYYLQRRYGWRIHRPLQLGPPPTPRHWAIALALTALASVAVSFDVARQLQLTMAEVWLRQLSGEVSFPTAPLLEEFVFRGVVLSELLILLGVDSWEESASLAGRGRFWLANLLASTVFTGLHWPWWIYQLGLADSQFWMNTAGVFSISIVLGLLFVRGRSLWPCVVLHWINNELTGLVPAS